MNDISATLISHNELTRRGEEVLRRSLNSLMRARDMVARQRPGIDVYIACCDDASTDATPEFIEKHFAGQSGFKLVHKQVNHGIAFTRNIAAALFNTEAICMLDADDEYKENHLVLCSDIMTRHNDHGKRLLVANTTAEFSVAVHPEWARRISITIGLTKVIRRNAWEFVEGMPTAGIFRQTGCEDQFFMAMLSAYFKAWMYPDVTVRYNCFPGSYFDRQMHKFTKPVAQYNPDTDDFNIETTEQRQLRLLYEAAFMHYLKCKANLLRWRDLFEGYSILP